MAQIHKTSILTIISLFVSLAFSSSTSSALITLDTTISSGGLMMYAQPSVITPINKFTHVYGDWLDTGEISFIASNFDLIVTEFDGGYGIPRRTEMQSLKAQNPNIKVFGYKLFCGSYTVDEDWDEVNAHEDWFVHDAHGNRLEDSWRAYMTDIGSSGWRQHWMDYVNAELASVPQFDGVYADIVYAAPTPESGCSFPNVPSSVIDNWHANTVAFLQYIKANLPAGKLLIINSNEGWAWQHTSLDYLNVVDGQEIEGYCHAPWVDANSYHSTWTLTTQLSFLSTGTSMGKIMLAGSGCTTADTRIIKWTYACFSLGINSQTAYWGWNNGLYYEYHGGHLSIMETNIGSPTGEYYSSQNVWMRDFTGGKILFNPLDTQYTVSLGGTYTLADGTTVTSVTLAARSGEILFLS
jgi:hypothetical protein